MSTGAQEIKKRLSVHGPPSDRRPPQRWDDRLASLKRLERFDQSSSDSSLDLCCTRSICASPQQPAALRRMDYFDGRLPNGSASPTNTLASPSTTVSSATSVSSNGTGVTPAFQPCAGPSSAPLTKRSPRPSRDGPAADKVSCRHLF